MRTTAIVIVILCLIGLGVLGYFVYKKYTEKKPDTRPKPNSSWKKEDWLKNGYSEEEIKAAELIQSNILNNVPIFV